MHLALDGRDHDDRGRLAHARAALGGLELEVGHELRQERLQLVDPARGDVWVSWAKRTEGRSEGRRGLPPSCTRSIRPGPYTRSIPGVV